MSQQLRNKLTGMIADQPEANTIQPATWETHVVIPLAQNLLGGLAVTIFCMVILVGLGRHFLWRMVYEEFMFWSVLAGLGVAATFTVIRFFGDEVGIVGAAYNLGKRAGDAQISALTAENRQLRALIQELRGSTTGTARTQEMTQRIEEARANAESLLNLAYGGQSIARDQVKAYMPQRPWERAMCLLRAAGCLDAKGSLVERNLAQALGKLNAAARQDAVRATQGRDYRPKWFVEAKH